MNTITIIVGLGVFMALVVNAPAYCVPLMIIILIIVVRALYKFAGGAS